MPPVATLPLTVQLGLGVGYLCYLIAYAGERRGHSALDAAFLSLAFGLPALLPISSGIGAVVPNVLFGSMASFGFAILWRGGARNWWHRLATRAGLSQDDGKHFGWEGIVGRPNLKSSQISVHTGDGRILYLNNRLLYRDAPYEGLYLGADGAILMVVEEERMPDGTEQTRGDISNPDWGARMTYIPADQVKRVNIRFR